MTLSWKTLYENGEQNAAIGGTEHFAATEDIAKNLRELGSLNRLIISNTSASIVTVKLDGLDTRLYRLTANGGSLVIKPEDGIRFNFLTLTYAAAVVAGEISVIYGVVVPNG